MARIRSIHPGLWTDERFVSLSPLARLLFIGLLNECDDGGTFVWSPIALKMRLLPADNADPVPLLDEMMAAGCAMRYAIDGRWYGSIRNFCRFQRPQKPKLMHPQTDEVRYWSGNCSAEGGGRREEGGGKLPSVASARAIPPDFVPELTEAAQAIADRIGEQRFARELDRFKDHHRAKGSTMKDWQAAFRTWLSRCEEYGGRNGKQSGDGLGPSTGAASDWINGARRGRT